MSLRKIDAEVITIGDELNRGEIADTNSPWLAGQLTELGAHVRWRSSVTDDEPDIEAALRTAAKRARVVVCSGGLGPTDDDRTVDVVARLTGRVPVTDAAHESRMRALFASRSYRMTPNNLRQVRVPEGGDVLPNECGLAPGFRVMLGRADLFFMPGVPREMKMMFERHAVLHISRMLGDGPKVARRTFRVFGMTESQVDHALAGLMAPSLPATLHFRIAFPELLVTVIARHADSAAAQQIVDQIETEVRSRIGSHVYGLDNESLGEVIGRRLIASQATLALAESCTGGLLGELVTAAPGSSGYFLGGVVSYSNQAKIQLLGVQPETLAKHGAVSEETAIEMARGAQQRFASTFAIAVTGVAGPSGGSDEKPVGTVFIAVASPAAKEAPMETRKLFWQGERADVRRMAAFSALGLLHKILTH